MGRKSSLINCIVLQEVNKIWSCFQVRVTYIFIRSKGKTGYVDKMEDWIGQRLVSMRDARREERIVFHGFQNRVRGWDGGVSEVDR